MNLLHFLIQYHLVLKLSFHFLNIFIRSNSASNWLNSWQELPCIDDIEACWQIRFELCLWWEYDYWLVLLGSIIRKNLFERNNMTLILANGVWKVCFFAPYVLCPLYLVCSTIYPSLVVFRFDYKNTEWGDNDMVNLWCPISVSD